jgi:hypothetical protein
MFLLVNLILIFHFHSYFIFNKLCRTCVIPRHKVTGKSKEFGVIIYVRKLVSVFIICYETNKNFLFIIFFCLILGC